mmetsp:Transcript_96/g.103  ORF Transcript_96/g.103 Transcript_96/m.103 type:complete len:457 (+) Transcript_96:66-1436(+)
MAGKYEGTYFDPSKRRLALQLRNPDKVYEVDPMHSAAEAGNFERILKAWHEEDNAIVHPNHRGQNCFHLLARFGHHAAFVKLFEFRLGDLKPSMQNAFDRGIRDVDKNKQRVLHLCVQFPLLVDLLLAKVFGRRGGNAINGIDYKLRTPLHRACLLGCVDSAEVLLSAGAFIDIKDLNLQTPLHLACIHGSKEIVESLILFHIKLLEKKRLEARAAAEEKRKNAARGMRASAAPINDDSDKATSELALMTWLNERDANGQTGFEIACQRGHNGAVSVLVEHGAMKSFTSKAYVPDNLPNKSLKQTMKKPQQQMNKIDQMTLNTSSSSSSSSSSSQSIVRLPLPYGGIASPVIPIPNENDDPTSPKWPKLLPIESAVMGGHPTTVGLLRKYGAGTSITGASLAIHHPVRVESLISRSDGICEQCLFRQQWQCGHRRADFDASTKSTDIPELRSWRSV